MIAAFEGLSYRYPRASEPALRDVTLSLEAGAFVLVAGPSGGGKSTLLRTFNGLVPQFHGGQLAGRATVAGLDPARTPARRMAAVAGMVFQEPEAQAITDTVEDEVAFGMEQAGVDPAEMARRVDRLLGELGIDHLRYRRLATLSGGERQRVAIAAVLALGPELLVLDEPTSQLDPAGAKSVFAAIAALREARGLTVVAAEHRLERLLHRVDTAWEVEVGVARALAPRVAAAELRAVPPVCELGRRLGLDPVPLTVAEAREALAGRMLPLRPRAEQPAPGDELLRVEGLTVAYGEQVALADASFVLREGEVVALVGANGSGKSTLFRALAGLQRPASGRVFVQGKPAPASVQERTAAMGLVPQDPALALSQETVRAEVGETLAFRAAAGTRRGLFGRSRSGSAGEDVLARWALEGLGDRNPRDISVGQQQRVAVAAMLAHEPRTWLLDEPTRGADAAAKAFLARRLRAHAAAGGAAVVATHDAESAAHFATRVIGLEGGRIAFDLPARQAFGTGGPLATQIAQLVPGGVTVEDVAW